MVNLFWFYYSSKYDILLAQIKKANFRQQEELFVKKEKMKLKVINPHNQSVVGEINISSKADIKKAVKSAKSAFPAWKAIPIEKRVKYIVRFRDLVAKNKDKIAKLTTTEMGKPINQSYDDVAWELTFLDYYVKSGPKHLADETVYKKGKDDFRITYEPYGVCACIAPWNFPLSMANSGIIPALIAGNTVVFKPSEYCIFTQKIIVDLLAKSGLPKGVINLVVGGGEVGRVLVDEEIDLAWFTGSTKDGQEIYK